MSHSTTSKRDDSTESFTYEFALSIAVVRHLQRDPLLPVELIRDHWPGHTLRSTYRRFDECIQTTDQDGAKTFFQFYCGTMRFAGSCAAELGRSCDVFGKRARPARYYAPDSGVMHRRARSVGRRVRIGAVVLSIRIPLG